MSTQVLSILIKNLQTPDEVREFPRGKMELVYLGDTTIGKFTLEPGWRWSNDVRPLVNTASCQVAHTLYVISGKLNVIMDDGTTRQIKAGDAAEIPPGHDAYVAGNETFFALELSAAKNYAKNGK